MHLAVPFYTGSGNFVLILCFKGNLDQILRQVQKWCLKGKTASCVY